MNGITQGGLALGMLWLGCSCSTTMPGVERAGVASKSSQAFGFSHFEQGRFADADGDGLPDTRLGKGLVAKLDDVTNGNDDLKMESGIPVLSTLPVASFLFKDGERGESHYPEETNHGVDPKAPESPEAEQKMIYTASFGVMVPTIDEAVTKLMARTKELGGYLSQRQNSTLTVRIPASKFQTMLAEIPSYGRITAESQNAQDVTSQHTDLTIRLENAEKSRKRLLALLEKAQKMEDVIKIEEALRRITGEIESMKGQLKLLNNQVAFSTITVGFQANAPEAAARKQRQNSRFPWINRLGVEQELRRF